MLIANFHKDETPAPPTKPAPEANVKAATPVAKSVSAEQVPQEPAAPTTTTGIP